MTADRTQPAPAALYTPEQRRRRDETRWTMVQGILAPLQFIAFAISLVLVLRYVWTGEAYGAATASILVKTALLYAIMVTGALREKEVFGRYLFAGPFYWEDVFSMLVLALHTLYVAGLVGGWFDPQALMAIALAAYAAYVINAGQFLRKFRLARIDTRVAA